MEKALRGDKISHIYFIIRLILTCIGFVVMDLGLLILGVTLSNLPTEATGHTIDGLNIFFGAVGFFIVVYCVIVTAIGVAYNLVPILVGSSMKKKFLRTNNPKYIRDSLMLKGIFLGFGILSCFSLITNMLSNELYFTAFGSFILFY